MRVPWRRTLEVEYFDPSIIYLFYPSSQKASDEKLESLQFCLNDDELEISLGIHVACLVFD